MNQAERRRNRHPATRPAIRPAARRPAAAEGLEGRQLLTTVGGGPIAFASHVDVAFGTAPVALAAADFNRDGDLDVVAVDVTTLKATVLFGNGAGGFSVGPVLTLPAPPAAAVAGDFNGDGLEDVSVACSPGNAATAGTTVTVFLGVAGGAFGLGQTTQVEPAGGGSTEPVALAAGDFNGDGHLDLAVTGYASSAVAVLLGAGTGAFAAPIVVPTGIDPAAVVAGDFTGDGHLDLAVAAEFPATVGGVGNGVSVYRGDGTGNFTHDYDVPIDQGGVQTLATADLNGDGKPDLVAGNAGTTASVFLDTTGTLTAQATVDTGAGSTGLAIADFNLDGSPDIVSTDGGTDFAGGADTVTLVPGAGNGLVAATSEVATGNHPVGVAAGDFNNDGKPDLVTADEGGGGISVLLNTTVINQAATATTLAVDPASPAAAAAAVTLTATITPAGTSAIPGEATPTGTVGFYDGSTLLGDETVAAGTTAGTATATFATTALAIGGHKLTAVYRGDVGYAADTSPATAYVIAPTATTGPDLVASFVASGLPNTLAPGSAATVKVKVTNQGNTVAAGLLGSSLYLSLDATLDGGDTLLALKGSLARTAVRLQPNASVVLTGTFTVPAGQPVGAYVPIVVLNTLAGGLLESSTGDNTTVSPTTTAVADAFGSVGGRANVPLTIADADGTTAVLHLTGPGTGTAALTDEGLDLTLTGTTARTTVTVTDVARGGTFTLDDVSALAAVGAVRFAAATLAGAMVLGGGATTVQLGPVTTGSVAVDGAVRSVSVASWAAGAGLSAGSVGTLASKGEFAVPVAVNTVTHAVFGGDFTGSLIANSTVGSVRVAGNVAGVIGVDVLSISPSSYAVEPGGSIRSVTIGGTLSAASRILAQTLPKRVVIDHAVVDPVGDPRFTPASVSST